MTDIALVDLAAALGLELVGDGARRIRRPAHPAEAGPDDLAVAMDRRYADALAGTKARAAILWPGADPAEHGLDAALIAPRPRYAMAGLTSHFAVPSEAAPGVHPSAVIDPSAELGPGVAIGPLAVVGPGARLGSGTVLLAHASLGAEAEIGAGAVLHPGVRVGARCRLGDRVLVHANAVIGADGFSFTTPEPGAVEAAKARGAVDTPPATGHVRIHSLGAVAIGDDVEIGAGATIDRGTLRDTIVGAGTKIDNQVQVGHNVRVGRDCLICAQVGLAGSAEIGDRVVLGGKVGVADNIRIGDDSVVAGASAVGSHVPPRSVMMGVPAMPRDRFRRLHMALGRLPRMMERLAAEASGKL
ncbi:MAG: UDP-3-O-(3-hydroxymyristoyl)glucosamine N-acyltransferase [Paracoccaceae bacterium]